MAMLVAQLMRTLLWIALYAPAVALAYALCLCVRRREPPRWASAMGWLFLCVLPAMVYQAIWWLSPDSSYSVTLLGYLAAAPVSVWVLLGGGSVIFVFEAIARDLTGHRTFTMVDNLHVFLALTAIQVALLVAILVRRGRPLRRDPVARAVAVLVVINALVGATWPWWGS